MSSRTRSVQARIMLLAGAALLSIAITAMACIGYLVRANQQVEARSQLARQQQVAVLRLSVTFKEQVQEWKNVLLRGGDAGQREKYWSGFRERSDDVQRLGATLAAELPAGEARDLVTRFNSAHAEMSAAYQRGFDAFAAAGYQSAAGDAAVKGMDRAPTALLGEAATQIEAMVAAELASGTEQARRAVIAVATVLVLMLGAALPLLSRLIRTRVSQPLSRATESIEALARGERIAPATVVGNDEVARVLQATASMDATLTRYVDAQRELHRAHVEAGQVDARLPASDLPGVFGEMARQANDLVAAHIAVTDKVVAVASRYAAGDLSVDMERLPGQLARVTDAVDGIKAGLVAITGEIMRLVGAARAGALATRGDASRYREAYRDVVEGLNELMGLVEGSIGDVAGLMAAMARGDLREGIEGDRVGAFARLQADGNQTVDQLTRLVRQIRQCADSIARAASEISAGNSDLAERTSKQAGSLEEVASAMEQLTGTVKHNSGNAQEANRLAAAAAGVATRGGEVVQRVVTTMAEIEQSSRQITEIIAVIDGIAFQTNLLALNAAVEAARAGEQGRGFAVVAAEVRGLAQRSADAARQIKSLIADSGEKVSAGTTLVGEAGRTIQEVVGAVRQMTQIIGEITTATLEQTAGIEQVNASVVDVDGMTQQNSALVEQAAAAAQSLNEQASELLRAVAVFQLGDRAQAAAEEWVAAA